MQVASVQSVSFKSNKASFGKSIASSPLAQNSAKFSRTSKFVFGALVLAFIVQILALLKDNYEHRNDRFFQETDTRIVQNSINHK